MYTNDNGEEELVDLESKIMERRGKLLFSEMARSSSQRKSTDTLPPSSDTNIYPSTNDRSSTSCLSTNHRHGTDSFNGRDATGYISTNDRPSTNCPSNHRVSNSVLTNKNYATSSSFDHESQNSESTNDRRGINESTNGRSATSSFSNQREATSGSTNEKGGTGPSTNQKAQINQFEMLAKTISVSIARKNNIRPCLIADRVMYARSQQLAMNRLPVSGGTPITQEFATALRTVIFGSSISPIRGEWARTGFVFRDPESDLAYGLKGPRNGTRGLLTVVQAYVIKNLLFPKKTVIPGTQPVAAPSSAPEILLKPTRLKQLEALYTSIADILWRIGEKDKVTVALPSDTAYVAHSLQYFTDNVTERLQLFEISDYDELQILIKRYIYLFIDEHGPGALLLLYSAVATRGTAKTLADFKTEANAQLICGVPDEGPLCIVMLMLSGRATPYLHNGIVYVGDEEHYAVPQYGILTRSEIGFLLYEESREERVPGSRLKTPSVPIWVVCSMDHYGVLFNSNRELLRNYHAERRFDLTYYSCGGSECAMTIDTRHETIASSDKTGVEEAVSSSLANIEKIIHTKWQDAQITWNGTINSL